MEVVVQNIIQLRAVLLIACAAGAGIFLFGSLMSLRDLDRASFRLERTAVLRRAATYFLRALLFVALGAAIYWLTNRAAESSAAQPAAVSAAATPFRVVVPAVPTADLAQAQAVAQNVAGATPNADPLSMPTPSLDESQLVVVTATPLPGVAVALPTFTPEPRSPADLLPTIPPPDTPTPFAIPTATPAPTSEAVAQLPIVGEATPHLEPLFDGAGTPAVATGACGDVARLSRPQSGETTAGAYEIVGSAVFAGGTYRIEIVPAGESVWRHLWEGPAAMNEQALLPTPLQTTIFPNGAYFVRMIVLGSNKDEVARCAVSFTIQN